MLAIAVHSHSATEQVDERGSDGVTAGSSYCAVPVVLFCCHTAFFSLSCSLTLCSSFSPSIRRIMAVTMTTTSVNYFLSRIAVLLFSAFLSDTFIYARSSFIVLFFHSFTFEHVTQRNLWKSQHRCSTIRKRASVREFQCQFTDSLLPYWARA